MESPVAEDLVLTGHGGARESPREDWADRHGGDGRARRSSSLIAV